MGLVSSGSEPYVESAVMLEVFSVSTEVVSDRYSFSLRSRCNSTSVWMSTNNFSRKSDLSRYKIF